MSFLVLRLLSFESESLSWTSAGLGEILAEEPSWETVKGTGIEALGAELVLCAGFEEVDGKAALASDVF